MKILIPKNKTIVLPYKFKQFVEVSEEVEDFTITDNGSLVVSMGEAKDFINFLIRYHSK